MNQNVVITCALTGAGDTVGKSPHVPVTPEEIANDAIAAANAGAAVVHIHVRDPATGKGGRAPEHFREVVRRIRASGTDVILNLTAGMGGTMYLTDADPRNMGPGTDLVPSDVRFQHIEELLPEICTIDCGSMNFGEDQVVVNRPMDLRWMTKRARELGVKPELEIFDMGQMINALNLIEAGLIEPPPMFQICLGIGGGAPATPESMMALKNMLPPGAHWAAFGISRSEFPMLAQAMLLGGHVRVGLEDNLYLGKGQLATNAQLVEKAVTIVRELGANVCGPADARKLLRLPSRT